MTLQQQVHDALDAYLDAHSKATDAAAAYLELKRIVGGNESERKAAKATMPAEQYDGYLAHMADAEKVKLETAAAVERTEKTLNVLREMYQGEIAEINRGTADLADKTAQRYAALQLLPPARPAVVKHFPSDPDF